MALQKSFILPDGREGNYIRVGPYRHDRNAREASVFLQLFRSEAYAESAPNLPIVPVFAKLRLTGDRFDAWASNEALAAAGKTLIAQFYAAAKVEPLICDLAPAEGQITVLADAVDV
ncbi:MAG: hypothetical protein JSS11_06345 [Verrucomicrobia bacterium]|nr:hypothetical protein [Verrucomicrobiota bacterium]